MPDFTPRIIVFLVCVVGFTIITMISDIRTRRIPNKLTLPFFVMGLIYQLAFHGWEGLGDGLLGFAVGFGSLFILWLVGGGGGGDVKLMGALSVWLGFRKTLLVLIGSTVFVLIATVLVVAFNILVKGPYKTKREILATGKDHKKGEKPPVETLEQKSRRRIMAFAFPVAVATWGVLILRFNTI